MLAIKYNEGYNLYVMRIEDIEDASVLKAVAIHLNRENSRLNVQIMALESRLFLLEGVDPDKAQLRIAHLEELLRKREQALFGASTEQRSSPAGPGAPDAKKDRKGHGPTEQLGLRIEEKVHVLPVEDRTCGACGGQLSEWVGEFEESEEITIIEREPIIVRNKRQKFRCTCNGCVKTAPPPPKLIEGGRYSIDFAVEVTADKFLFHSPLERQARKFIGEGLLVSSQTLWDQIWALSQVALPTYQAIRNVIIKNDVIHADETTWHLLDKQRSGGKKWYVWEVVSQSLAYFEIHDSRSQEAAAKLLKGFQGTVMADGYTVYQDLARTLRQGRLDDPDAPGPFQVANCWAHARRGFIECEVNFPTECKQILDLIAELYMVEREVPFGLDDADILAARARLRAEKSAAIINRIKKWCDTTPALPQSGLGKAIAYLTNQWVGLTRFLENPRVALDNNLGERTLRGSVLGRKNFYGSKSRRGTEAAAIMYTLFESAKLSGVNPKAYVAELARRAIESPGTVLLPDDFKRFCAESAVPIGPDG